MLLVSGGWKCQRGNAPHLLGLSPARRSMNSFPRYLQCSPSGVHVSRVTTTLPSFAGLQLRARVHCVCGVQNKKFWRGHQNELK
jgi:hypothetical protein